MIEHFAENKEFYRFREGMRNYFNFRREAPVQAFINSIALPSTIEDLLFFIKDNHLLDPEQILLNSSEVWSVPRWCKKGDIVFFMITVSSAQAISHVRAEMKKQRDFIQPDDYRFLNFGVMREESIYDRYGGTIFAIGRVSGNIETVSGDKRVYARVDNIIVLDQPLHYDQFKGKVPVSKGGSITPVYSEKYSLLKDQMSQMNSLPDYVLKSRSEPIRESSINRENWLEIAKNYRFHYTLEEQFRKAFVDYLLKDVSDSRKLYAECYCKNKKGHWGFIDNVVLFNGKYLPVEVKLNVDLEADLIGQVSKYCSLSLLKLTQDLSLVAPEDETFSDKVIIIDTFGIYLYDDTIHDYQKIYDFFSLSTKDDLKTIRDTISVSITGERPREDRSFNNERISIDMVDAQIVRINALDERFRKKGEYTTDNIVRSETEYDNSVRYRNDNAYEEYLTTMLDPEEALKLIEQMVDGEDLQKQGISGMKETKIRIIQGDITKVSDVEAIVNAANQKLLGGGGVDGAIHKAAGPKLLEECRSLHGCNTGEAKLTKAYNLPCKYVIHTVGPIWHGGKWKEAQLLADCYTNSLLVAISQKIRSVAFPSISTGVYCYPLAEAAEIAITTVKELIKTHPGELDLVEWVLFDRHTFEVYENVLNNKGKK